VKNGFLMRSLLFVPGNRPDMLEKSISLGADVLVPDMEDSVPIGKKSAARETISDMLPRLAGNDRRIVVRVNSLDTGMLEMDLESALGPSTFGINVGKVESEWDVRQIEKILYRIEGNKSLGYGSTRLIVFIESAKAVLNAESILGCSPRIIAAAFGAEDFTVDMDVERTENGTEVFLPRAMTAMAAVSVGITPLDVVYTNFRDSDGLQRDIKVGQSLGYKGKFAIHPSQIPLINDSYTPSSSMVDYARRVVEVFNEAENKGRGATSLDGQMIDVPVVKRAQKVLDAFNITTTLDSKD